MDDKHGKALFLAFTAAFLLLIALQYIHAIPNFNARFGNSGHDYFNLTKFADNFVRDFPTQAIAFHTSLAMHAFTVLGPLFDISPDTVGAALILAEFAALAGAAAMIVRLFQPTAPYSLLFITLACMTASNMRARDLAYHSHPHYMFYFYVLAYSLECAGLVYALRNKAMPAYLLLASAFLVHPGIGAGAGLVGTIVLVFGHPRDWKRLIPAGGAALVIVGIWSWLVMDPNAVITKAGITMDDWLLYVGFGGVHFFPIKVGLFGAMHYTGFTPFLILLGLGILSAQYTVPKRYRRPVLAGLVGILCLTALSLLHTSFPVSIALLKLNLHRSTHVIQIFALVLVCIHAYRCMIDGPWYKALPAAALLGFGFLPVQGIPLLWALLFTLVHAWDMIRERKLYIGTCLALALLGLALAWAAAEGTHGGRWGNLLSGVNALRRMGVAYAGMIGLLCAAAVLQRFRIPGKAAVPLAAVMAVAVLGFLNCDQKTRHYDEAALHDYMAVQVWAREHTEPTALFMLPPDYYYGWRAYSRRSSFGNIRDWLYSWGYTSDAGAKVEGLARARELGIPLEQRIRIDSEYDDFKSLRKEMGAAYHAKAENWFASMARRYGIDYFVFDKKRMQGRPLTAVAYETDSLLVCRAP